MARTTEQSIEWHKECLTNWRYSLLKKEAELARLKADVERTQSEISFYGSQVDAAIDKNMAAFDRDRFMKTKGAKNGAA